MKFQTSPLFKLRTFAIVALSISAIACGPKTDKKQSEAKTSTEQTVTQPTDPIERLKAGNERFMAGKMIHPNQDTATVQNLIKGQNPFAVIISCSDSRVPGEIIFDQGLGDLFTIRTAGNVMSDYEEGSIEYAVEHLGTKLVVVTGHTNCGAVKAFLEINEDHKKHPNQTGHDLGHIQAIIDYLGDESEMTEALKSEDHLYENAIKANVVHGVKQLRNSQPILSKMYKEGKIQIVGAIYDLHTGKVDFLDIK